MSTLTQFVGGIKSIQRGTFTIAGASTTGTATITSVDTTKTKVRWLGNTAGDATVTNDMCYIVLTNATTITGTRSGTTGSITVSWELTEYY